MTPPRQSGRARHRSGRSLLDALLVFGSLGLATALIGLAPPTVTAHPQGQNAQASALINKQLDDFVDLEVRNRPLPEVLEHITQSSGIPFTVSEQTYAMLPYGRETPITINARNTPLRQTLDAITRTLGLSYVLRNDTIEIRLLPALQRTGRRATVQEIAGLDVLASHPLDIIEERPTVAQALEAIDLALQQIDTVAREKQQPEPGYKVEARLDDFLRDRPVFLRRGATLLQALDSIAEQTKATWYPWGDSFIVLPKEAWVRSQLDAPIDLVYNKIDVQQVLVELERASGVPFTIEPGALQQIPEGERQVELTLLNTTTRTALENLSGATGLGYTYDENGVYVYATDAPGDNRSGQGGARRRINSGGGAGAELPVLMVQAGEGMTLLLYERDLPEELRARLRAQRAAAIRKLSDLLPPEPQN